MLAKFSVADYMEKKVVTVSADTDIFHAVKKMLDHKITSVPVVDGRGNLLGVFSERDGVKMVAESGYHQSMSAKVGDVMSTTPQTISSEASLVDAALAFQETQTRSFPVFQQSRFVGMISRVDVLRALLSMQ